MTKTVNHAALISSIMKIAKQLNITDTINTLIAKNISEQENLQLNIHTTIGQSESEIGLLKTPHILSMVKIIFETLQAPNFDHTKPLTQLKELLEQFSLLIGQQTDGLCFLVDVLASDDSSYAQSVKQLYPAGKRIIKTIKKSFNREVDDNKILEEMIDAIHDFQKPFISFEKTGKETISKTFQKIVGSIHQASSHVLDDIKGVSDLQQKLAILINQRKVLLDNFNPNNVAEKKKHTANKLQIQKTSQSIKQLLSKSKGKEATVFLQVAETGVQIFSQLIANNNPKLARQVNAVGNTAMKVCKAVVAVAKGVVIGSTSGFIGSLMGGASQLISQFFSNDFSNIPKALTHEIKQLSTTVNQLGGHIDKRFDSMRILIGAVGQYNEVRFNQLEVILGEHSVQMHSRFDQVIEILGVHHQQMHGRFDTIDHALQTINQHIQGGFNEIINQLSETQRVMIEGFMGLHQDIQTLQQKTDQLLQQGSEILYVANRLSEEIQVVNEKTDLIDYRKQGQDLFTLEDFENTKSAECRNAFLNVANTISKNATFAGTAVKDDQVLIDVLGIRPIEKNINLLAAYARQHLAIEVNMPLANPHIWAEASRMFIELNLRSVNHNTNFINTLEPKLFKPLKKTGKDINNFIHAMLSEDIFFKSLFHNYKKSITQILDVIGEEIKKTPYYQKLCDEIVFSIQTSKLESSIISTLQMSNSEIIAQRETYSEMFVMDTPEKHPYHYDNLPARLPVFQVILLSDKNYLQILPDRFELKCLDKFTEVVDFNVSEDCYFDFALDDKPKGCNTIIAATHFQFDKATFEENADFIREKHGFLDHNTICIAIAWYNPDPNADDEVFIGIGYFSPHKKHPKKTTAWMKVQGPLLELKFILRNDLSVNLVRINGKRPENNENGGLHVWQILPHNEFLLVNRQRTYRFVQTISNALNQQFLITANHADIHLFNNKKLDSRLGCVAKF